MGNRYSEMFAESRTLTFTIYHGMILTVVLAIVSAEGSTFTQATLLTWLSLAMVWFTFVSQVMLFLPRCLRQVTQGDFTKEEMLEIVKHQQRRSENDGRGEKIASNFGPAPKAEGTLSARSDKMGFVSPRRVVM
jgi:hypothetical protein